MSESLTGAVDAVANGILENLHTCIPAEIVIYDGISATVRPKISKAYRDGTILSMPDISGVPVRINRTRRAGLSFDLLPGDPGLLFFSERDITSLKKLGSTLPPASRRKFDLNDAFFVPYEFSELVVEADYKPLYTTLYRTDAGFINFKNNSQSWASLLSDTLTAISTLTTVGSATNQAASPAFAAQMIALRVRATALFGAI